jgi:hypothetical protein
METFKIEVKETLSKIIEIQANSNEEALLKIEELYKKQEIVLNADNFIEAEFHKIEN